MKYPIHTDPSNSLSAIQTAVPLGVVKKHLRVQHSLDDDYIQILINNAIDIAQETTGKKFFKTVRYFQTEQLYAGISIYDHVFSINSIRYLDMNSELQYVDLENVLITNKGGYYLLCVDPLPLSKKKVGSVKVMYQVQANTLAGESKLPGNVLQAILLMVGEFYEYREDRTWNLPKASERLLKPFIDYGF